jgi:hypothetical protein
MTVAWMNVAHTSFAITSKELKKNEKYSNIFKLSAGVKDKY